MKQIQTDILKDKGREGARLQGQRRERGEGDTDCQ